MVERDKQQENLINKLKWYLVERQLMALLFVLYIMYDI